MLDTEMAGPLECQVSLTVWPVSLCSKGMTDRMCLPFRLAITPPTSQSNP